MKACNRRYEAGATNTVGTGYFGNHLITGTTAYMTTFSLVLAAMACCH